ncbi:hypothetical protein LQU94_05495 [Peptoniphilus sp. KCTC 25270]|uniref:hypothetical protein n=1 Tax=Peptoniphilus sp. KCTC 25270 TaxID=2897414 RepID=UPI001E3B01A4|nr:hypothetical protein [Peptoniphilus sp. KCTC 25270]MCD1147564.1 hypothetical protein [Peptoniphilus sp. KCTC 25270]
MNKNQKDERHLKPPEEWTEYESALDFQERCNSQSISGDLTPAQIEGAEEIHRRTRLMAIRRLLEQGYTVEFLKEKHITDEQIQEALSIEYEYEE